MKTLDGTGATLIDTALYFIQDTRQIVGNCGLWWAPDGKGYECDITKAGKYLGARVKTMSRDTDVAWPVEHVLANTITHVRVDTKAFHRFDDDAKAKGFPQ